MLVVLYLDGSVVGKRRRHSDGLSNERTLCAPYRTVRRIGVPYIGYAVKQCFSRLWYGT